MPLVEFKCPKCGNTVERIVKVTQSNHECGCGEVMVKQIGKTTFFLTGNSWAKDGYK